MVAVVNTNVMSLNAQRNLNKSQATSNQAMERLSSGLRINSAKDDAAGLAISTGMQSQIKGMNQAIRNSNDGVSMAQTAEGSMDEMTNILQRMRELSVQSSNATNSSDNRKSIQTEVDQLYSELGRISESTQFNGTNLLDGSAKDVKIQIGADNGNTMSINIKDVSAHGLGIDGGVTKGDLNGSRVSGKTIAKDTVKINDVNIGAVDNPNKLGAAGVAEAINKKSGETNVTATAYNSVEGAKGETVTGNTDGLEITVGQGEKVTLGVTNSMENLRDTINKEVAGVNATISSEGQLQLTNDTGESIKIGGTDIAGSGLEAGTSEGFVALSSTTGDPIKVTSKVAGDTEKFGLMETNGAGSLKGVEITANASITEDDAVSINGQALVVEGAVLDAAAEPPTHSAATAGETVDAINKLTDQTGVTAKTIQIKAQSGDYTTGTRSTSGFTVSDDQIKAFATDTAVTKVEFDGEEIDMSSVTDLDSFASALNKGSTKAAFEVNEAGNGISVTAGKVGTTAVGAFAVTGTATAGDSADAATALGTAVGAAAGTDAAGTAGKYAIALTAEEGTEIVISSDAKDATTQSAAIKKLGMIATGGTKADDLGVDVTTAEHAGRSMEMIDKALGTISSARADLGAVQNRLGSTISNLENVSQNLSASNSRIQDADFAAESSKMSKSQILQQAGTSMLSQANASAQSVLSLLG